ncbi:MAG TPA: hypothetical protein VFY26_21540 [Anaerolineales bacterium]|nr:hypothetical protein [Anaerolineales bacterium]
MKSGFKLIPEKPILLLLAVNLIAGLFIFGNYGLSWDEPLFYDYGNALGYAYSPPEWFSGRFDVDNSYGSSGDDHKTRGPAYLLLARGPVRLLETFGVESASAWHLVNFLFFQIGVYFLYRLSLRWMKPSAALAAAALFGWQPMLWGHAFINPKDPPFMTFFLAAICLGFEMVDRATGPERTHLSKVILPAILLGIATSIRVLGPLAGVLVFIYFLYAVFTGRDRRVSVSPWLLFFGYGFIALLSMFLTWPYLWEEPLSRFLEVFRLMSDNPASLSVLFAGEVFRAGELPRRYLPLMLGVTLTEPVWILFALGVVAGYWKLLRDRSPARARNLVAVTLVLLWFVILVAYVIIRQPAMYDGIRHFLFILPPIFLFSGFIFEFLVERSPNWLYAGIVTAALFPGLYSMIQLHPYEYTYYNSFVGGTQNAFRRYETDYWLTCYKEAVEELNHSIAEPATLFVHREAYIAEYYAGAHIAVRELRGAVSEVQPGDYVLVNSRTNEDRRVFRDAPHAIEIRHAGALFCTIKRVP